MKCPANCKFKGITHTHARITGEPHQDCVKCKIPWPADDGLVDSEGVCVDCKK